MKMTAADWKIYEKNLAQNPGNNRAGAHRRPAKRFSGGKFDDTERRAEFKALEIGCSLVGNHSGPVGLYEMHDKRQERHAQLFCRGHVPKGWNLVLRKPHVKTRRGRRTIT